MSGEEVRRVRVGKLMKWAPMLGYDVPDEATGIDLVLLSDGSVRWEDPNGEVRPGSGTGA